MKNLFFLVTAFSFFSCNNSSSDTEALKRKVDSLEIKINNAYKPGLGEFMSQIQVHHAKLWFAGKNQNWELADFEIGEIQEALNDIPVFCSDRPEVKSIGMITPVLYNISDAVKEKNVRKFDSSFVVLTATCNDCHKATSHAFNLIKIPDVPPVSNQVFKP